MKNQIKLKIFATTAKIYNNVLFLLFSDLILRTLENSYCLNYKLKKKLRLFTIYCYINLHMNNFKIFFQPYLYLLSLLMDPEV